MITKSKKTKCSLPSWHLWYFILSPHKSSWQIILRFCTFSNQINFKLVWQWVITNLSLLELPRYLRLLERQPADWFATLTAWANKQLSRVCAASSSWPQLNSAEGREILVSKVSSKIKFFSSVKIVFSIRIWWAGDRNRPWLCRWTSNLLFLLALEYCCKRNSDSMLSCTWKVLQSLSLFWLVTAKKVSAVTDTFKWGPAAGQIVCHSLPTHFLMSTDLSSSKKFSSFFPLMQMVMAMGDWLKSWLKATLAPVGLAKYFTRHVENCQNIQLQRQSTSTAGSLEARLQSCLCFWTE